MRGDKRMISSLNTLRNPGVLWLILVRLQNTDSELPLKSVTRWLVGLAHQSKNHTGYINNLHSKVFQGFLLDSAVNNPPANAEDVGLIPDLGRSHTPWSNWARGLQISIPGSTTTEHTCPRAHGQQQKRPQQQEAQALRWRVAPSRRN